MSFDRTSIPPVGGPSDDCDSTFSGESDATWPIASTPLSWVGASGPVTSHGPVNCGAPGTGPRASLAPGFWESLDLLTPALICRWRSETEQLRRLKSEHL